MPCHVDWSATKMASQTPCRPMYGVDLSPCHVLAIDLTNWSCPQLSWVFYYQPIKKPKTIPILFIWNWLAVTWPSPSSHVPNRPVELDMMVDGKADHHIHLDNLGHVDIYFQPTHLIYLFIYISCNIFRGLCWMCWHLVLVPHFKVLQRKWVSKLWERQLHLGHFVVHIVIWPSRGYWLPWVQSNIVASNTYII